MGKKRSVVFLVILWMVFGAAWNIRAQETSSQQPSTDKDQEKTSPKEKAVALLEQTVAEAAALRQPENRLHIQIAAGDLLWDQREESARALFSAAAAGIIEMMGKPPAGNTNNRQNYNQGRSSVTQLRQELLLAVARHNATLAYQLLQATQPQVMPNEAPNGRRPDSAANLEQRLVVEIAKNDPQLALKSAQEWLDKGQYPNALAQVLSQLQLKDKDAAASLSDKLLKQLQTENYLAKQDAGSLALLLLRSGPRPADTTTDTSSDTSKASSANPSQVLSESAFRDLLETVIVAALKATPAPPGTAGGQYNFRGGPNGPRNGGNTAQPPDPAQIEQNNARSLLMGLQSLLPQIDQYAPGRATAVRQKLSQLGLNNNPRFAFNQVNDLMQQGTSDSLLKAATTAPGGMQANLYQQAALKALDEGNADRARQIANDHLNPAERGVVLQMADTQQVVHKADDGAMEGVRQALGRLPSDDERIQMVLQLSTATQKDNPKLALQILGEGKKLISSRATNYQQFDAQIRLAKAFATFDPAQSFEVLEPGISQLNELLSAAALLNGFEVNLFKDGELQLEDGGRLANTVNQYAEELAALATSDFERARTTAGIFQRPEARILTQLAIAQGLLGGQPITTNNNRFGNRGGGRRQP